MRRLAMLAVTGVVAFAQLGPDSSSGAASPSPSSVVAPAAPAVGRVAPRMRATAVDQARASLPLPKASLADPPAPRRAVSPRASRSSGAGRGDVWAALARCESGGNPSARSANGRYTGAFQFSNATWQSLGYGGSAADHPYEVQVAAAQRLQARSGWGQWPRCARRLGLR
ncbi:MAG TPA: transglycosylase family protein [Acidimicrobiales bacterium]|nr:transglycosylase family protein [Acidimicrobiales bacterium]